MCFTKLNYTSYIKISNNKNIRFVLKMSNATNNPTTISIDNFTLTITENAYTKLTSVLLKKDKPTYFRLKISSGGCSGFSTMFALDENYDNQEDLLLDFGNNVKIIIHKQVAELIGTAELHYKQDLLNSYFALNVAAAKESCSCGSSFGL